MRNLPWELDVIYLFFNSVLQILRKCVTIVGGQDIFLVVNLNAVRKKNSSNKQANYVIHMLGSSKLLQLSQCDYHILVEKAVQ